MTPNRTWTPNSQKLLYIHYIPPESHFFRFALWPTVFKIQGRRKSWMHRMTPKRTFMLNSQSNPAYTKYLPQKPKIFGPVRLAVSKIKVSENWKCTKWGEHTPAYTLQSATGNPSIIVTSVYHQVLIYSWIHRGNFDVTRSTRGISPMAYAGLWPMISC